MKMSDKGLEMLKKFEGFVPHAYDDLDHKARPLKAGDRPQGTVTIGYGHIGRHAKPGNVLTEKEASAILAEELQTYERAVERAITRPMNQNEFDAMVSLCYNIGASNFERSSVKRMFNAGSKTLAAQAFLLWNKSKGRVLNGLVTRRRAERELFLTPPAAFA